MLKLHKMFLAAFRFACCLLRQANRLQHHVLMKLSQVSKCSSQELRALPLEKERGGEVGVTVLPSTSSHHGGACRCKLTPCSTYQSGSGVLFERKRMALLRCFYTAVLLQCCVLETGAECTELVIRFKLYGCPHCCVFSRRAA